MRVITLHWSEPWDQVRYNHDSRNRMEHVNATPDHGEYAEPALLRTILAFLGLSSLPKKNRS